MTAGRAGIFGNMFSDVCLGKKIKILPDSAGICIELYWLQIKSFRLQIVNTIRGRGISEIQHWYRNFLEWKRYV